MIKLNKFIAFVLGLALCPIISGCAQKDAQNLTSDVSSITQNDNESEDIGIILPEDEFDTDEQNSSMGENADTNTEDDNKTSSSAASNKDSSSQNNNSSSSADNDETSSTVEGEEENTSSDTTSEPSQDNDGSIELPFDKW